MTLYCICRSKNGSGRMIACDSCEEWFHFRCVKINKSIAANIKNYYCDECKKKKPSLAIVYEAGYQPEPKPQTTKVKQEPLEETKKQDKKIDKTLTLPPIPKKQTKPKPPKPSPEKSSSSQPRKRTGKSKGHNRKQCANPDCLFESRSESKYCSDECAYAFNKLRYETHFIPKWNELDKKHSQARLRRMTEMDQIEKDKLRTEELIAELKVQKADLEQSIKMIKEEAGKLCKENAKVKELIDDYADATNDETEESTTGDQRKQFCVSCGQQIVPELTTKHWTSCHKKQEASFNFTADILIQNDIQECDRLYCYVQDKKTKRYCMQLASACPQHANWGADKDEVCGCPLNIMQKLVPDGNYCLDLKRDCTAHYHWDKFRLAQMNMQRAHAQTRFEMFAERLEVLRRGLDTTYGGVLGVMLHNTIDHVKPESDDPVIDEDEPDVDVEMTAE